MTFQHLAPVCASARGDALLLLTRHADIFAGRLPRDPCTRVLLPLLARAADQGLTSPLSDPHACVSSRQSCHVSSLLMFAEPGARLCLPRRHMHVCTAVDYYWEGLLQ